MDDFEEQGTSSNKRRFGAAIPLIRDKTIVSPYGLRQGSKLPSRYRDEEPQVASPRNRSPRNKITPRKINGGNSPIKRLYKGEIYTSKADDTSDSLDFLESMSNHSDSTKASKAPSIISQPRSKSASTASLYEAALEQAPELESYDLEESLLPVPTASSVPPMTAAMQRRLSKLERDRDALAERLGTKRLEHTLSLHKARRWTICEFFYSSIDEPLFLLDNEFKNILKEGFPSLKTSMLNKQQWRTIRRLLGKPRRCSALFFAEEREALEQKRNKIRTIYDGSFFSLPGYDISDLPTKIPRALTVGNRVYARIHYPKDGIYSGTIDAVLKNGYRIIFEKEDMIPPLEVDDTQVMLDGQLDMVPINYFIEQVSAKMPFGMPTKHANYSERKEIAKAVKKDNETDKVGNFPVRMLVILVKLSKLIDLKKKMVRQLSELNAEAEKVNLLSNSYSPIFQEKYAQVVIDLETINKQMAIYMQGVQEYNGQLSQQLTENHVSLRADNVRKHCAAQAQQIVRKHNSSLNVTDSRTLSLITSLSGLLLQIRSLGQHTISPIDLQTISETMSDIHSKISPKNAACFQDHVEVHMKQIHTMMLQSGALTNR